MPTPTVTLIAAIARDGGIGLRGELLVRIPDDLRRFKRITMGFPVLMGRATWESIGRPLPGRLNIVMTRSPGWKAEGASAASSLAEAMDLAAGTERLFVIGGARIYALALPVADALELTEIDAVFPADTFFPAWNRTEFRQTSRDEHASAEGLRYSFVGYRRI